MKAKNSNLDVIFWECDEHRLNQDIDIKISEQSKGGDIDEYPGKKKLQIKWRVTGFIGTENVLNYLCEDNYRLETPKTFKPNDLLFILAESFKRVKDEFKVRTSHLGEYEFDMKIPHGQLMKQYKELGYPL